MSTYRRNRVPGAAYFFTANLADRRSDLLVREIATLRAAIRAVLRETPFHIDARVVLPDHLHCIWTLPENDSDYSNRWRALKTNFTKTLRNQQPPNTPPRPIWQNRFWEHTIRDDHDYRTHMDYIHFNPVKHGLAPHPAAWPHSTFQKCVALGLYPPSWSSPPEPPTTPNMGERP